MCRKVEEWRDIPGFDGFYQASDWGRIRSFKPKGRHPGARMKTPRMMRLAFAKSRCYASLASDEHGDVTMSVGKFVALAFYGELPEGAVVCHRNGDVRDNRLCNLEIRQRGDISEELMRKYAAGSNRIPVLKIDRDLNILEAYSSISAAARANGVHETVIGEYCRHVRTRSVFAPDGCIYAFDDERHLRKTLDRAMAELDALGARYNDPGTERYYDLEPEETPELDGSAQWEDAPPLVGGGYCGY